ALHLGSAHEGGQGAQRLREPGQRLVLVDAAPPGRRHLRRREPGLEVHVANLQPALDAMGLGIEAADEMTVMEDRQHVVTVPALGPWRVDLASVVDPELARRPAAR